MTLFLLCLLGLAAALLVGVFMVFAVAAIPLNILARAEEGGRFAGLGQATESPVAAPPAGRHIPPLLPARAYGY